jgi:hypothetical protein
MSEQDENVATPAERSEEAHPLEEGLDVYPLRAKSEDPRWALRTVWTWVCIAVFLLVSIVVFLLLGLIYD